MSNKKNTINIYNIAQIARVSPATVSRVINHPEIVKKDTFERVNKEMQKYKYIPSYVAQSLRTNKTKNIGLILEDIGDPFMADLIEGVEEIASINEFNLIIICIGRRDNYTNIFFKSNLLNIIDGVILLGSPFDEEKNKNIMRILKSKNIKLVLVGHFGPSSNSSYVLNDNFDGGYIATDYLVRKNHKNIAFIGINYIESIKLREEGYKKALIDSNISVNENFIFYINSTFENIDRDSKKVVNFLLNYKSYITGCFISKDLIASRVLKLLNNLKIKIPEELSIVGFDDIDCSKFSDPPLTTIHIKKKKMGATSAKILIDNIICKNVKDYKIILKPSLIERATVRTIEEKQ